MNFSLLIILCCLKILARSKLFDKLGCFIFFRNCDIKQQQQQQQQQQTYSKKRGHPSIQTFGLGLFLFYTYAHLHIHRDTKFVLLSTVEVFGRVRA